jgi:hypothetical protein
MPKDNQLSTVLLLVALGFLIYYLTKPKTVSETFAQEEKSINNRVVSPKSETPKSEAETPKSGSNVRSEVKQEVLKQILSEAEKQKTETPVSQTPKSEIRGDQMDVFQFEPSDIYEAGAQLESAFQRPIPQQATPDVVNLNKNNVKNYNAKDFLPKEINNQWFDTDFSQAKFNINDDKLINTERYVIGINTVGQSLKNATYDIRGTVPNPKFTVSPWNNSTYEPDMNLKSLC